MIRGGEEREFVFKFGVLVATEWTLNEIDEAPPCWLGEVTNNISFFLCQLSLLFLRGIQL